MQISYKPLLGLIVLLSMSFLPSVLEFASFGLKVIKPPALNEEVKIFHYDLLEQGLAAIESSANGHPKINDKVEYYFSEAGKAFNHKLPPSVLGRIDLLSSKQIFNLESEKIKPLVLPLLKYVELKQSAALEKNNINDPLSNYEKVKRLQNQVFGTEVATQIFGEQRQLTEFYLNVHRIDADQSLSAEQKQDAIEQLQKTYPLK